MSNGKTILARVLAGTCVGCNVFPLFGRATGGEGEVNESGPGTGVAKGVVSFPRGELTGTVKPSPHIPGHSTQSQDTYMIHNVICLLITGLRES